MGQLDAPAAIEWLFKGGFGIVFLKVLVIDFVALFLLACLQDGIVPHPPFWWAYLSDIAILPGILAGQALALQNFAGTDRWYTSRWWLVASLALAVGLDYLMESDAVHHQRMTWMHELRWSKGYHTLVFAFLGWALIYVTPATLVTLVAHRQVVAAIIIVVCVVVFLYTAGKDQQSIRNDTYPRECPCHPTWAIHWNDPCVWTYRQSFREWLRPLFEKLGFAV